MKTDVFEIMLDSYEQKCIKEQMAFNKYHQARFVDRTDYQDHYNSWQEHQKAKEITRRKIISTVKQHGVQ